MTKLFYISYPINWSPLLAFVQIDMGGYLTLPSFLDAHSRWQPLDKMLSIGQAKLVDLLVRQKFLAIVPEIVFDGLQAFQQALFRKPAQGNQSLPDTLQMMDIS